MRSTLALEENNQQKILEEANPHTNWGVLPENLKINQILKIQGK